MPTKISFPNIFQVFESQFLSVVTKYVSQVLSEMGVNRYAMKTSGTHIDLVWETEELDTSSSKKLRAEKVLREYASKMQERLNKLLEESGSGKEYTVESVSYTSGTKEVRFRISS